MAQGEAGQRLGLPRAGRGSLLRAPEDTAHKGRRGPQVPWLGAGPRGARRKPLRCPKLPKEPGPLLLVHGASPHLPDSDCLCSAAGGRVGWEALVISP